MGQQGLKVLVADDDPTALAMAVAGLAGTGLVVASADSADGLLAELGRFGPDLVVVDHHLGPVLGADVLEAGADRGGSAWAGRVIAVTSDPGPARRDGRYAAVLGKPVRGADLVAAIDRLAGAGTTGPG